MWTRQNLQLTGGPLVGGDLVTWRSKGRMSYLSRIQDYDSYSVRVIVGSQIFYRTLDFLLKSS